MTEENRGEGEKLVMVFGTFDNLHPGHRFVFSEAKKHGDRLVAVIARDVTVEKVKGMKPHYSEEQRRDHVQTVPEVDRAVLGSLGDKMAAIAQYKPDVICLGYDQVHFVDELEAYISEHNMATEVVRLEPYQAETYKSSKLPVDRELSLGDPESQE